MSQENRRKIALIAVVITPFVYILFAFMFLYVNQDTPFPKADLIMLIVTVGCLMSMLLSGLYVYKIWNVDIEENMHNQMKKDMIALAWRQVFVIISITYFIISINEIM